MKIQQIFKGKKDEINLSIKPSIKGESFKKLNNILVEITFSQDAYWLIINKNRIEVEGATAKDSTELDRIAQNSSINLLVTSVKSKAEIKSKLLTGIVSLPEGLEIGLTDIIIDDINKRYSRKRAQQKHTDWLSEELIIQDGGQQKILLDNSPQESGFRIFGKSIAIDVKKNEDKKLEITRIIKWNNRFNPTFLLRGNIQIKDISKTASLRENIELEISKINSNERYINTWERYQKKEIEHGEKDVKARGFLTIKQIKRLSENQYKLIYESDDNTDNWLEIDTGAYIELKKGRNFQISVRMGIKARRRLFVR